MKIFKTTGLLLVLLLICLSPIEAISSPSNSPVDDISRFVVNRMTYPSGLTPKHEKAIVLVSFIVEPCGTVNILAVNASDESFKQHVIKKLSQMRFSEDECNEVVNVKFSFSK